MRQVYGWFLGLYKVSVAAGLGGYLLLVLEVFGIGLLLRPAGVPATLSLLLVWCASSFMLSPGVCITWCDQRKPVSQAHHCSSEDHCQSNFLPPGCAGTVCTLGSWGGIALRWLQIAWCALALAK